MTLYRVTVRIHEATPDTAPAEEMKAAPVEHEHTFDIEAESEGKARAQALSHCFGVGYGPKNEEKEGAWYCQMVTYRVEVL